MKQVKQLLTVLFVGLLFVSCEKNKDVKQFALDFAEKVSKNQVDLVRALYPDAAKCDSFALAFNADSIQVTETETPRTFKVTISGADFTVKKAEDGKMTVTESHGLLAYPDSIMVFAKKTGWLDTNLNDKQNAERLSDDNFISWNVGNAVKEMKAKMKIEKKDLAYGEELQSYARGFDYRCTHTVVVANNNDFDIPGEEYYLSVITLPTCDVSIQKEYYQKNTKRIAGKPIPAHGTVSLSWKDVHFDGTWSYEDDIILNYAPSFNKVIEKMKFTGNEYEEYPKQK